MGSGLQSYRLKGDPERHYTATRHGSLGKLDALYILLRFEHGTKRRGGGRGDGCGEEGTGGKRERRRKGASPERLAGGFTL